MHTHEKDVTQKPKNAVQEHLKEGNFVETFGKE